MSDLSERLRERTKTATAETRALLREAADAIERADRLADAVQGELDYQLRAVDGSRTYTPDHHEAQRLIDALRAYRGTDLSQAGVEEKR